jgi:hypothetical protein
LQNGVTDAAARAQVIDCDATCERGKLGRDPLTLRPWQLEQASHGSAWAAMGHSLITPQGAV